MSFNNDNLLGKSIQSERKHYENPLLRNVQSGVWKAITVGGNNRPEGRGRIAAYPPKLGGDPDNPLFFQYASPLVDQMLKVLTACLQSHQTLVLLF